MGQLSLALVPLLAGIILGVVIASVATWRILYNRIEAGTREIKRLGDVATELQSNLAVSQSNVQNLQNRNGDLRTEIEALKGQVKQSDAEQAQLKVDLATVRTELEAERRQTPEKTAFLNDLANQILEDKLEWTPILRQPVKP